MVEKLREQHTVKRLCRALSVSQSGYYAWRKCRQTPPSARRQEDARLTAQIVAAHKASRGAYGSLRIRAALCDTGTQIGRCRVMRLMRAADLQGLRTHRRRVGTTVSDPAAQKAANILNRDFTAKTPNQKWVTDATYIETRQGWLYLVVLLDLFSRKVVGWATSADFNAALVCKALKAALETRAAPALHHSDRGVQFTSLDYMALLKKNKIESSMSRIAQPYDNAVMESFFATLKEERLHGVHFATHQQAQAALFEYIESEYNRTRIHSTIGYTSPDAFERKYWAQQALQKDTGNNNCNNPDKEKATTALLA
jgi:putative transposase